MSEAGYAACEATEARLLPYYCSILAAARAALGNREEALAILDRGLCHVKRANERIYEAEMWRRRAALLQWGDDHRGAEGNLRTALEVAGRQGAKMWELRAAHDLARI